MAVIEVIVVVLVTVLVVYYLSVLLSGWRQKGRLLSDITGECSDNSPSWRVYYFYSPSCGACRNMTPSLEVKALNNDSIQCIDVSVNTTLARKFNVRATPTAILVEQEKVTKVLLGSGLLKQLNQFILDHENAEN